MTAQKFEQRLAALEVEVQRLRQILENGNPVPWWDEYAGAFANDPIFDEVVRLSREYRESTRPKPKIRRKKNHGDS